MQLACFLNKGEPGHEHAVGLPSKTNLLIVYDILYK